MTNKKTKKKSTKPPSLIKALLVDIFVSYWMVTALGCVFVCSSMMLAYAGHDNRRLTTEWQKLRQSHQDVQAEWKSLRLEQSALRESDRISDLARKQLNMLDVNSKNEKVISL